MHKHKPKPKRARGSIREQKQQGDGRPGTSHQQPRVRKGRRKGRNEIATRSQPTAASEGSDWEGSKSREAMGAGDVTERG